MTVDYVMPALLLIGAFYVFAGVVAVRAVLSMRLIDVAIAAIGEERPDRRDMLQQLWLLCAAVLIFAGGLGLLLRAELAAALFVVSALLQLVYLMVAAPYYFDVDEPPDSKGRAGTTNAAVLYGAATAFVVWSYWEGHLVPNDRLPPLLVTAAAVLVLALAVYALWTFFGGLGRHAGDKGRSEADMDADV